MRMPRRRGWSTATPAQPDERYRTQPSEGGYESGNAGHCGWWRATLKGKSDRYGMAGRSAFRGARLSRASVLASRRNDLPEKVREPGTASPAPETDALPESSRVTRRPAGTPILILALYE